MKNILVTGAAGHLGAHLVRALAKAFPLANVWELDVQPGFRPRYRTVDVREMADLSAAFDAAQPDLVYHLAGLAGRIVCEQAKGQAFSVNVVGTMNVGTLCSRRRIPLIHASTSEVYGPAVPGLPMHEEDPPDPNNWYGWTKWLGEEVLGYIREDDGLDSCVVRPFMLYHEDECAGEHRSAMIRFATAIRDGLTVELHEGTRRGWLHYDDFIRFMVALATADRPPVVNFGNPDIRPVEDLIPLMEAHLRKTAKVRRVEQPARMTPVKDPCLDIQAGLGLEPTVTLEDGVRRVCERVAR